MDYFIEGIGQYVLSSCRLKLLLKLLLVLALLASWRFDLDPNVSTAYDAHDVGRADCAEAIEVPIISLERAGVVAVMKDVTEREIVEDCSLCVGLLHEFGNRRSWATTFPGCG